MGDIIKFGKWTLTVYPDHIIAADGHSFLICLEAHTAQDLWTALNIWVERMAKVEE